MYLVVLRWVGNFKDEICIVATNKEKAQEYIDGEMGGYEYNGTGYYTIVPVEVYE